MHLTFQSNHLTLARYDFNVYEKKVLYAIVDSISPHLKDVLTDKKKGIEIAYKEDIFSETATVIYRAKDLCDFQNYSRLRAALKNLQSKQIIIDTEEKEVYTSPVLKADFKKGTEHIKLVIDQELYQFLFDLKKGYTAYELKVAMSLPSVFSMRIYELLAKWRNKEKFHISVDDIRKATGTEQKLRQIGELKNRVLNKAKIDLDNSTETDLRFDYKVVKDGRRVKGFDVYVIKTEKSFELNKSSKEISPRWFLSNGVKQNLEDLDILLKGKTLEIVKNWAEKTGDEEAQKEKIAEYKTNGIKAGKREDLPRYIVGCMKKI